MSNSTTILTANTHPGDSTTETGNDAIRPIALVYINRLSDWLFVMGRWVSVMLGEDETLWLPLGKRSSEKGVADRVNKMRSNDDAFLDL